MGISLLHFKEGWLVVGAGRNGMELCILLIFVLIAIMVQIDQPEKHVKPTAVILFVWTIILLSCFKDPPVQQPHEIVVSADSLKFPQTDLPGGIYIGMVLLIH